MSKSIILPHEVIQKIKEYIPRDKDMKSSISKFFRPYASLFSEFRFYTKCKQLDDLSYFDFYFQHGYNHRYKYSYGKVLQFRGYLHYSEYSQKFLWENRFECEGEYVKFIGPRDDDDTDSDTESDN